MKSREANRPQITVTMTSYPARIPTVHKVVENMLAQTMKPDRVVLWLAAEQFPQGEESLPEQLLAFRERGLVIGWCEDMRSYKKLLPALEKYPDDILITVDDDLVYDDNMIEVLYECSTQFPNTVTAMRTHMMRFDAQGKLLPYSDWRREYGRENAPSMALFATTGGGTLFPPHILPKCTANIEDIRAVCANADDVWVKVMLTLCNVPIVLAAPNKPLRYVPGTQSSTLWAHNMTEGGNDVQLAASVELCERKHGVSAEQMYERFIDEQYDLCPEFSALIVADDIENTGACIESALAQTQYGIEVLCVCRDEQTQTALEQYEADQRVRLLSGLACGYIECVSRAAAAARGDYLVMLSPSDRLGENFVKKLMERIVHRSADIIRFAANYGSELSDAVYPDTHEAIANDEQYSEGFEAILRNALCYTSAKKSDAHYLLCDKLFARRVYRNALQAERTKQYNTETAAPLQLLLALASEAKDMLTWELSDLVYHDENGAAPCGKSVQMVYDDVGELSEKIEETEMYCAAEAVLSGAMQLSRMLGRWSAAQCVDALTECAQGDCDIVAQCVAKEYAHSAKSNVSRAVIICDDDSFAKLAEEQVEAENAIDFTVVGAMDDASLMEEQLNKLCPDAVIYRPSASATAEAMLKTVALARINDACVLIYLDSDNIEGESFDMAFALSPQFGKLLGGIGVPNVEGGALARLLGGRVFHIAKAAAPEFWVRAVKAACSAQPKNTNKPRLAQAVQRLTEGVRGQLARSKQQLVSSESDKTAYSMAYEKKQSELQSALDAKTQMERDLRAHLDKYAKDAEHLKQCIRERDVRCERTQTSLKAREADKAKLQEDLAKIKEINASLREELDRLKTSPAYRAERYLRRLLDKVRSLFKKS